MKRIALVVAILATGGLAWYFLTVTPTNPPVSSVRLTDSLEQTVVVPTLDTPIPEGKSAIWCASFQMAWNKMKSKVAMGPIQFKDKNETADRLNSSAASEKDLPPGSYYANSGLVKDGIIETIRKEMKEKFPEVPVPVFATDAVVAFEWLQTSLKFEHPFLEDSVAFVAANGKSSLMKGFGRTGDRHVRSQAELLFLAANGKPADGFSLLFRAIPQTIEIRISVIPRPKDLVGGLREIASRAADKEQRGSADRGIERLAVPGMDWNIEHRFTELEKLPINNLSVPNSWLEPAYQRNSFRLDRFGVELKSEAKMEEKKDEEKKRVRQKPVPILVDQPYLLELRLYGRDHPFFAMWVDNAELMQPK